MVERLNVRFPDGWTRVLEGRTKTSMEEGRFGEYTMYSVAALELAETPPPVRVCRETHVLQLHSARAFRLACFDSAIIHVVDKTISFDDLASRAARFGQELRPAPGRR